MSNLLEKINKPNDIKKIATQDNERLADDIRKFLLKHVSATGGHLASNLGAVELTMALHRTMDFPKDKIVWDVGHQSYTHKLLTGRKQKFDTLRQLDGMSGFPKRNESECDSFETGHSSTSISAALGMATARKLTGGTEKIVAVIGDGALTGGMALEALNNVSQLNENFVIILNDNNMSISENVGGMSNYLNKLRVGEYYNEFKEEVEHSLSKIPRIGGRLVHKIKKVKDHLKGIFVHTNWFDDLGITYIGPVDGHNVTQMVEIFQKAFKIDHPILIHVKTVKGKGYDKAEQKPSVYHGVEMFQPETGILPDDKAFSYTDVFSKELIQMARTDDKIVAITAAMADGTGLGKFGEQYPERFFDVGIAEEHAVTFAAGLATGGYKPFVSIYSSFYQRAYDQILHDVCLQNLPVRLIIDRAGLVGRDGETHQGIFDISFLAAMPHMTVLAPKDQYELIDMLHFTEKIDGPVAIRFGKSKAYISEHKEPLQFGKSEIIKHGKTFGNLGKVAIIAVGGIVQEAEEAVVILEKEGIYPTLVNARFVKTPDQDLLTRLSQDHKAVIVIEEGIKQGGYGQGIAALVSEYQLDINVKIMAIEDMFVPQGSIPELRRRLKLDAQGICSAVREILK